MGFLVAFNKGIGESAWNSNRKLLYLGQVLKVVTLLSTLRDPTQLRRRQCATRQQHPKAIRQKKFGQGLENFVRDDCF